MLFEHQQQRAQGKTPSATQVLWKQIVCCKRMMNEPKALEIFRFDLGASRSLWNTTQGKEWFDWLKTNTEKNDID